MNKEAYEIRSEINRLKQRLLEIEENELSIGETAQMCASNVCGQDVILQHLQRLCKERNTRSIANMSAWKQEGSNMWYSTTITPQALPYLIKTVNNIVMFYEPILKEETLRVMEFLSIKCESALINIMSTELEISEDELGVTLAELSKLCFIKKEKELYSITKKGWQIYIVLSHLAFNYTEKLEIETAFKIVPAFKEVFDKEWGEYLGINTEEAMNQIEASGWLNQLQEQGVSKIDIEKAVYQANYRLEED